MKTSIDIGKTDRTAADEISENFKIDAFPARFKFKNFMPRDIVLPEIEGLFLRHCGFEKEAECEVLINNQDELLNAAASIEQIAELNGYEKAVRITILAAKPTKKSTEKDSNKEA